MMNSDLVKLAEAKGATVVSHGNGHFQIKGALLVNYYPLSKSRTAYVAGTVRGKKNCSPAQAVEMAFSEPQMAMIRDRRSKNSHGKRYAMLKKKAFCHWCNAPLTLENSTIEHLIPLARGGLDNSNNRVLACKPCNHSRGCDMPELVRNTAVKKSGE
jgi:5-methylcytosine-specific restriction endonuclease McrA